MSDFNFTDDEILDLIREVGYQIEIGVNRVTQKADPQYGIPEQYGLVWRSVAGYVLEDSESEIALSQSQATEAGRLKAYIAANDGRQRENPDGVTRIELDNSDARLRYNGRIYQLQYQEAYHDRGVIRLHCVRLLGAG